MNAGNNGLEEVRAAIRALDESLKLLGGQSTAHRKNPGSIASAALEKLLRQEISGVFNPGRTGGGEVMFSTDNGGDSSPSQPQSSGSLDRRFLETMIDQMVADALVRGRRTTGILAGLFNIAPGLSGR
jgi:hypothetical protein